jgi:hypothetical protein
LASASRNPRAPEKVVHRLAQIIRFRMLMIAAGYEDGNDAATLLRDPPKTPGPMTRPKTPTRAAWKREAPITTEIIKIGGPLITAGTPADISSVNLLTVPFVLVSRHYYRLRP